MKKTNAIILSLGLATMLFACTSKKSGEESTASDSTAMQTETMGQSESAKANISIVPVTDSKKFPDAMLDMNTPAENAQDIKPGPVDFNFTVKNYKLGVQTEDASTKESANSAKGQHIHLILNNGPYSAHYTPEFSKDLEKGHYVALAFLSRSYHESLKNYEAFVLRQFTVGRAPADSEKVDLTKAHMFYSRPKGTYTGKDTKNVLLDFFLVNAELSPSGYKVRATIDGQSFMIDKWQPYYIKGMPMGENTIKLEFLDKDGNLVDSPFNPVERTVTLEAAPAS